jgi:hypothetical protein
MLMMKKPKNLEFEPLHPKNVLFASVVHGISCLLILSFEVPWQIPKVGSSSDFLILANPISLIFGMEYLEEKF